MKIEITPIFSELRYSVEIYRRWFPLKLSGKNNVIDVYFDNNDATPQTLSGLAYLIAQSKIALVVVHKDSIEVNGMLTPNGEYILDTFERFLESHMYSHLAAEFFNLKLRKTYIYGMLHPGLVYTE